MRKLVLYTLMSLDGAVDRPDLYFPADEKSDSPMAFDAAMIENEGRVIGSQDAVLLGRHMFDEWSRYWPTSSEQPFADFINSVRKYVVTSTPLTSDWQNAEAVTGRIENIVADLKGQPGRDIGVHGSIQLAQSLLAAGLVDELQLVVGPTVGFPGRRLFTDLEVRPFALLSATPTPSGSLLLGYRLR